MPNLTRIVNLVTKIYKQAGLKEPNRPGKKSFSDLYLCQLAIVQYLKGFSSQSAYLRHLRQHHRRHFPKVPSQSQYNHRITSLQPILAQLLPATCKLLQVQRTKIRIIDSTPVPVIRLCRMKVTKAFTDRNYFGLGYCQAKKEYYYGEKLTLVLNQQGIPASFHLMPANRHDVKAVYPVTRPLSHVWLIGDKGYTGKKLQAELWQERSIRFIIQRRKNQTPNTDFEKKKLRHRQLAERVFSQLKDLFQLETLRAKTHTGLFTRVTAIIVSLVVGMCFNQICGRNLLKIKTILS